MRWWGLEAAGRHRATSCRELALQRVSENNELCSLWSPGRRGVLKGLAFSYLKIQVTENALDCFVSVFVWTVLLWVEGRYMVSAEFKSRCSYDVASSLENGIIYTVNGGKPSVYFGEEIEVPWLWSILVTHGLLASILFAGWGMHPAGPLYTQMPQGRPWPTFCSSLPCDVPWTWESFYGFIILEKSFSQGKQKFGSKQGISREGWWVGFLPF